MTTLTLHAQPYDTSKTGFYFTDSDDYDAKFEANYPCEEYEIQFIDGDDDELALSKLVDLEQCNIVRFFDLVDENITGNELLSLQYLVLNRNMDLSEALEKRKEVNIFKGTLAEYAQEITEEGEELSDFVKRYFDYESLANDMDQGGECDEIETNIWVTNVNEF